jgi:replication initiation and membrane attachment protein DnaB
MSKTPVTWLELIKMKLNEEKKNGKSPSIGDVVPEAKKEWVQVKNGTHPKYTQGKAKTFARKGKKNSGKSKTKKNTSSTSSTSIDILSILEKAKVCKKCRKSIEKIMNKKEMKGGDCGCSGGMSGGCSTCTL